MKITAAKLEKVNACGKEVGRFKREFPNGLAITKDNLLKVFPKPYEHWVNSYKSDWAVWFAGHCLSDRGLKRWVSESPRLPEGQVLWALYKKHGKKGLK